MPQSKVLVEKLIKVGHLRRYLREVDQGVESGQATGRIITNPATLSKPRPAINYILGSPADDQYQFKRRQKRLARVAMVKARVNVVHAKGNVDKTCGINQISATITK